MLSFSLRCNDEYHILDIIAQHLLEEYGLNNKEMAMKPYGSILPFGGIALLAVATVLFAAACKNPVTAKLSPTTATTAPQVYLYVSNDYCIGSSNTPNLSSGCDPTYSNGVSAFSVNSKNGILSTAASFTFTTATNPMGIAITPNGKYLYAVSNDCQPNTSGSPPYCLSSYSNGISAFAINSSGALSPIGSGFFSTGPDPKGIAVSPNGDYLYVTNSQCTAASSGSGCTATYSNGISAYTIGSGGALSSITSGTFTTGPYPTGIAVSPNGDYLYVTNSNCTTTSSGSACTNTYANGISAYTIGSGGALSSITSGSFTTGPYPEGIAIDPSGSYLYVANSDCSTGTGSTCANGISAFTIGGGGALKSITPGTFITGRGPTGIAISPNGKYLYVTNSSCSTGTGTTCPNGISAFTIGGGGALTSITSGTFTTGRVPTGIAIDPNGSYLYVTDQSCTNVSWGNGCAATYSPGISAFTIGTGGTLSPITSGAFTTGPYATGIAIGP